MGINFQRRSVNNCSQISHFNWTVPKSWTVSLIREDYLQIHKNGQAFLNGQHKNVKPDDWNAKAFELCLDMRTVNPRYPHIRQFPFLSNQSNHGFLSNFFSVNNFRKTNQILRTTDSEEANILRPLMSGNFSILEPAKI